MRADLEVVLSTRHEQPDRAVLALSRATFSIRPTLPFVVLAFAGSTRRPPTSRDAREQALRLFRGQGRWTFAGDRDAQFRSLLRRVENARHHGEDVERDFAIRAMRSAIEDRARHVGEAEATIVGGPGRVGGPVRARERRAAASERAPIGAPLGDPHASAEPIGVG